jgi:transcription elongation factor GreA
MQTEREVLITPSGLQRIEEELETLRTVHRRRVAENMREAWDDGVEVEDNSGLEDARNQLAYVEGRIDELREILAAAKVIEQEEVATDEVGVGSIVKVKELETGDEWEWTIVGTFEADPGEDRISYESPVGKSLMGKKVGNVIPVQIPAGRVKYEIMAIGK